MNNLLTKLTSRKFWMAAAAFLGSLGAALAALGAGYEQLAIVGTVCAALSASIYAAAESYVDGKREASNITTTQISANTTAKEVVEKVLTTDKVA